MRNLKRVLSLALALVMVLGMMVMTTSAAAYADAEEITYTEAVEVMSAIGILEGNPDGTFAPKGTLTREQAAKILAYVCLGADAADYLTGSAAPFDDVAATKWSAKFVAFCKNAKIIDGVGDNKFNPAGTLTTVQFAKMLLAALGIDGTFTGSGWDANVKAAAEKAGLDVITIDHSEITREEACEMALAAMLWTDGADYYVLYNDLDDDGIVDAGETVKVYAEAIDAYFAANAMISAMPKAKVAVKSSDDYLLYDVYGVDAFRGYDAYGRPSNIYYKANALYMVYADTPVAEYESSFNKDVVDAMVEINANAFTGATIKYNGFDSTGADEIAELYDNKTPINGMTVELYNLDNNVKTIERVVVIEKNLATVSDVTLTEGKTAGSVSLDVVAWSGDYTVTFGDNLKSSYDDYDFLCGYKKDTVLVVTMGANYSLLDFEEPTAVEGKITKMNVATTTNSTTVAVDGTEYKMSQMFKGGKNLVAGAEGTLYLTAEGYAIGWASKSAPKAQYAYVLDDATQTDIWSNSTYYAKLLYTDGTTETVEVSADANPVVDTVVTYAEGTGANTGKIVLSAVSGNKTAVKATGSMTITENSATIGSAVANDKTVFVVQTTVNGKPVYTVYTGVKNVPGMSFTKMAAVKGNGVWDFYFAMGATLDTTPNTAKSVVYLTSDSTLVKEVISATKTLYYYEVNAVVNGEITTVKVAANTAQTAPVVGTGLYDALTYNDDGLVIAGTAKVDNATTKVDVISETGTAKAKDGIIVLGTTSYIYDDATVVYKVANGNIATTTIGALKADSNDTVVGFTTNGILTMVVVTSVNP